MKVSVIDYGLSNLLSVCRAVEKLGHEPSLIRTGPEVREANILILPGVGAFSDGMAGLIARDMLEPLWGCAESNVPILGICLGMQMLFESSREYGIHRGLGLIPGHVERICERSMDDTPLRIPHIGWAGLLAPESTSENFTSPLLRYVQPGEEVYFVHSYAAQPKHREHILSECSYGGNRLCAAVGRKNIYGTQFHPEKSGPVGLKILQAFLQSARESSGSPSLV